MPRGTRERAAERRSQAIELRKGGYSYREIAKELGCSLTQAWFDVKKVLDDLAAHDRETAAQVRKIEIMRLDTMVRGLWPNVQSGDSSSVMAALKVSERRSKLMGLDAPVKNELTGPDGGPLAISNSVDLTKLSDDDLTTLATILERAGSSGS